MHCRQPPTEGEGLPKEAQLEKEDSHMTKPDFPTPPPLSPGDQAAPGTPGTGENICPKCTGSGSVDGKDCENCSGTGRVIEVIGGA
jgi:hypothetical protein